MKLKRPFEFEITPETIDSGTHWITIKLQNVSEDTLTNMDIRLHSMNPFFITVLGTGSFLSILKNNETGTIPFQVNAEATGRVYFTVSGERDGVYFYWDSPPVQLTVGDEIARLRSVFILTHPYIAKGTTIEVEAVIQATKGGKELDLTFWLDSPTSYEFIGETKTKMLESGEEVKYSVEISPKEEGIHEVFVYLFDGTRLVGKDSDAIWVEK